MVFPSAHALPKYRTHASPVWFTCQGKLIRNFDNEGRLNFMSFSPFRPIKANGKQSSLATIKHRKKDIIALPEDMKVKSTSILQGCLGADEDWVMRKFTSEALHWQLLLFKRFLFNQSFPTPPCYQQRKGASEKQEELVRVTERVRAFQVHRSFTPKDYFRAHPPTHIIVQRTEALGDRWLVQGHCKPKLRFRILIDFAFPSCSSVLSSVLSLGLARGFFFFFPVQEVSSAFSQSIEMSPLPEVTECVVSITHWHQ